MYKGKFANNQKGRSTAELLKERSAQEAAQPDKKPVVPPMPKPAPQTKDFDEPVPPMFEARNQAPAAPRPPMAPADRPVNRPAAPQQPPRPAAPAQNPAAAPVDGASPMSQTGRRPVPDIDRTTSLMSGRPMAGQTAKPAPIQKPAPKKPAASVQKPSKKGSTVFYGCYFGFIFLFSVCTFLGLTWLEGWLTDYEAAQPGKTAEAYFNAYFVNPNWGALYDNSVTKGTDLEGKEAYVSHMNQKVGTNELTYQETSAGLSGDKKYFVKLGDEKIASFVLKGDAEHITDIPNWTLGDIELIFKYDNNYRIQLQEGHKAFVNDMELDESYTIMKASTMAKDFLPAGTKGITMWTQEIKNLMGTPTVRVVNEKGEEMPVIFDQETKTFTEQTKANSINEDQRAAAIGAAEVYGKYMISQANRGELAKYFDASSEIYTTIRTSEKIVQQSFFKSFDFGEETVSDFCMYSDDLFSAHVHVVMNVTRKDGTVKPYDIDTNFFFSKQSTGKWLAYDMTNEPVLEPVGQVRLTFMHGSEVLATGFYDTNATEIDTPLIAVPEGKVFSGWTRETVGEGGQKVLEVMFTPDETGHVVLPVNNRLEPMVLTALFENASN